MGGSYERDEWEEWEGRNELGLGWDREIREFGGAR